jgi:Branched-chain amino acid aminotransferase/4-amino-4-deoxychorismate lyase
MGTVENSKFVLNNCIKDISEFPAFSSQNLVTVYEVVRVMDGKVLFLDDHLERFFQSFKILDVVFGQNEAQIRKQLELVVQANHLGAGNVKFMTVIDKEFERQDFIFQVISHSYPTEQQYKNGVAVATLVASRISPNAKVQNDSLRDVTDRMISEKNVYEIILIHPDGLVTEGSRSNIFMIKEGIVKTPRLGDVLPGVTRKNVIKACNYLNLSCMEADVTHDELLGMDAVFITGTSPKVLPVNAVDGHPFDVNNSCLRAIMKKFDEMIDNYIKS